MAQLVEQLICNHQVGGSNPSAGSNFLRKKSAANKSTIERDELLGWTTSIWSFTAESAQRVRHPAPFPIQLPARVIGLYTFEDDAVLDLFIGSSKTTIAAKRAN